MRDSIVKFRGLALCFSLTAHVLLSACTQSFPGSQLIATPAPSRVAQPTDASSRAASLQTLEGWVVGVADGDTITVLGADNR